MKDKTSESLKNIEAYKRKILTDLYNQLQPSQQVKFNLVHGALEKISNEHIDFIIVICERALAKK